MSVLTKDERYEIYRLTKRARGLYKAEKQALVFIGEAQTMQDGVCRKALKSVEDFGFGVRQTRFGLHGRRRNGKIEFPGLIARGIVSAVRNQKGGRAPGGHGLPTAYAINRDVLLMFIPDIDDPLEKDEPKGGPSWKKDEPLGEPKEELMPPRSCSSPSSSLPTSLRAASDPSGESSPRRGEETIVVDDDGEAASQSPTAASNDFPLYSPPGNGSNAAGAEMPAAPADGLALPPSSGAPDRARPSENEKDKSKDAGRENQPLSESPDQEARTEQIISSARQRQLERKASVAEIYREFKGVFDRLTQARKISLTWTPPKESHKQKAAELYRAIGLDAALSKWEQFLIEGEHDVPQQVFDEELSKTITFEVQRTWLLLCFVNEHSVPTE
jgi:hypothetical protein